MQGASGVDGVSNTRLIHRVETGCTCCFSVKNVTNISDHQKLETCNGCCNGCCGNVGWGPFSGLTSGLSATVGVVTGAVSSAFGCGFGSASGAAAAAAIGATACAASLPVTSALACYCSKVCCCSKNLDIGLNDREQMVMVDSVITTPPAGVSGPPDKVEYQNGIRIEYYTVYK